MPGLNFCGTDDRREATIRVQLRVNGNVIPGKTVSATLRRDHRGRVTLSMSGKIVIPKDGVIEIVAISDTEDTWQILPEKTSLTIERLVGDG